MPTDVLNRAAALCSRSEHCEADVRAKLTQWQVDPAQADAIVARLRSEGFVDNRRYARAYVHDKFLYNGWGPVKLAAMLLQKHVEADAIGEALLQFTTADYHDQLLRLLRGKLRSVAGREPHLARAALLRYAASRGFEAAMAYQAVGHLLGDNDPQP